MKISLDHETNKVRIDLDLAELKTLKSESADIAAKLQAVQLLME